jgi:hypothetical protein
LRSNEGRRPTADAFAVTVAAEALAAAVAALALARVRVGVRVGVGVGVRVRVRVRVEVRVRVRVRVRVGVRVGRPRLGRHRRRAPRGGRRRRLGHTGLVDLRRSCGFHGLCDRLRPAAGPLLALERGPPGHGRRHR